VLRLSLRIAALAAAGLCAASLAHAQFSGLTTTTNGSAVWFSSPLRQRGTAQYLWSKIFRIDSSGAALVAEMQPGGVILPSNPYILTNPQVSGDGTLLVYLGTRPCQGGSSCFLSEQHFSTLLNTVTGQQSSVGSNAVISRNGRYLASYGSANVLNPQFVLADRRTSATVFQGTFSPASVSIAFDGTTAVVDGAGLQLIRRGMISTLVSSNVAAASIDDRASTIVYETTTPRRLFILDLKTLATGELGADSRDNFQATLSADGQWAAYLSTIGSTSQVFFSRTDGSDWQQLAPRPDGAIQVTLSGDASTVYAITGDQSLLRIDTSSGAITTLAGPTPTISGLLQAPSPGSMTILQGMGLTNTTVSIAGTPGVILSESDTSIVFQIPWDVPLAADSLSIPQGGAPYFDDATPIGLSSFAPQAIALGPEEPGTFDVPVAIHSDFRSLVTDENPALPGEVLHMYLSGGGAVSPPVATGVAAPSSPLSWITTPISVVGGEPVQVNFFGLAPGLIGVWQMDFLVPTNWSRPYFSFQIEFYTPPPNAYANAEAEPAIPVKTGN
jgi:uncharacterized protein (TIGR03437 family)